MKDKSRSAGNIFFLLFASVALVGAAAMAVQSYILGPLKTSSIVNLRSANETQMDIAMRVATARMAANNCDADPLFEPLAPESSPSSRPTGGGLLPMTIAGSSVDSWGSRYGYCVWDHGASNNNAGGTCAGQGVRLQGTTTTTWSSMVVVSAGANRAFETTCNGWLDANADSQPDTPLVQKAAGSDDMIIDWSYDSAMSGGGGGGGLVCTGDTWTARTAAQANYWTSVTYGNGVFVAVSSDGANRVMTSSDGITWTARTASSGAPFVSVTYASGLFVAVALDGDVMTSPDGITWTGRSPAALNGWFSVTYGNGLFVAVSENGANRVMTSPDGINWTSRTAAQANLWRSVIYGNGLFVAVSNNGTNRVMTSPDGITWTARTAAQANAWRSVTYGNGLFVAVSEGGTNRVMTSPDGITWTARTAAEANEWQSVTYANGLFVAVSGNGTNRVMTSTDGITWTARAATENMYWTSVGYGNGLFVAVCANCTNRVMTSSCSGGGGGGSDLWTDANPVAEIAKNLSVKDGSNNEQLMFNPTSVVLRLGTGGSGEFPNLRTNVIEELTSEAITLTSPRIQALDGLVFTPEDGSGISYTISNPTGDGFKFSDGTKDVIDFYTVGAQSGLVTPTYWRFYNVPASGTGGAEMSQAMRGVNVISSVNADPAMNIDMTNLRNTANLPQPHSVVGMALATNNNRNDIANLSLSLEATGAAATNLVGNMTFATRPLGAANGSAPVERMRIEGGGDVGIGITNPTTRFHVVGNAILGDGGNVGVNTTTIPEKLTINGALRLSSGAEICDGTRAGGVRYNTTSDCIEVCNGTAWSCMLRDQCTDISPDIAPTSSRIVFFRDVLNAAASTLTASPNTLLITGISTNCTLEVSVTGPGSPQSRICSDTACSTVVQAWTSAKTSVVSGQFVQIRATSPASAGQQHKITARIGSVTRPWVLGTAANCAAAEVPPGTICADGTVYLGRTPDGWTKMYTTPCKMGQTFSGGVCTGTATTYRFSNNQAISTGIRNSVTGESNTTTLAALANGDAPYMAAQACDTLSFGGNTDWYLPAEEEAAYFLGVCTVHPMQTCDDGNQNWTSTEHSTSNAKAWNASYRQWDGAKQHWFPVQCVRKD